MKLIKLATIPFLLSLSLAACSGTEYEVTGEISSSATVDGPITLEFLELADSERESISTVEIAEPGAFTETVELGDGSTLVVFALVDSDGDGACTEGELWAEEEVTPNEDGTMPEVALALSAAACPAVEAAE